MRTLADPARSSPSRAWVRTIREGTTALIADIDEQAIHQSLEGDEQLLQAFRAVDFTSQISVPLLARGRTLGGLTFTSVPATGDTTRPISGWRRTSRTARRSPSTTRAPAARQRRQPAEGRVPRARCRTSCARRSTPSSAGRACCAAGAAARRTSAPRALETHRAQRAARRRSSSRTCSTSRASSPASCGSNVQPVDLAAIVDARAIDAVRPAADAKGIRLERDARPACRPDVAATPSGCSRWCGTCCRTRSSSRPRGGARQRARSQRANAHVELDRQRHRAAASRRSSCRTSSSASGRPTPRRRASTAGSASACDRQATWSSCTAGTIEAESDGAGRGSTFTVRCRSVTAPACSPARAAQ